MLRGKVENTLGEVGGCLLHIFLLLPKIPSSSPHIKPAMRLANNVGFHLLAFAPFLRQISRAHRESLSQLVQSYVQSQASIAVQSYLARQQQHHQLQHQTHSIGGAVTPSADPSHGGRIRSISNAASIYPSAVAANAGGITPLAQKVI